MPIRYTIAVASFIAIAAIVVFALRLAAPHQQPAPKPEMPAPDMIVPKTVPLVHFHAVKEDATPEQTPPPAPAREVAAPEVAPMPTPKQEDACTRVHRRKQVYNRGRSWRCVR
jgi:hypothetical protein